MMANYRVTTLPALVAWVEPPTGGRYDGALRFAMGGASALRYGDAPDDHRRMGNAAEFPCLIPPSASRTHHAHRRPIQSPLGGEATPSGTFPLYPRCLLGFHGLGAQRGGKVCLYISRRTRGAQSPSNGQRAKNSDRIRNSVRRTPWLAQGRRCSSLGPTCSDVKKDRRAQPAGTTKRMQQYVKFLMTSWLILAWRRFAASK